MQRFVIPNLIKSSGEVTSGGLAFRLYLHTIQDFQMQKFNEPVLCVEPDFSEYQDKLERGAIDMELHALRPAYSLCFL